MDPGMRRDDNVKQKNGARSGGMTGRLLFRSAWGKSGPAGETGPVTRGLWRPLRFWMLEVVIPRPAQNAIRACDIGKNAYGKQELCQIRAMLRDALSQIPRKLHGRLAQMQQTTSARTGFPMPCIQGATARRRRIGHPAGS